MWDDIYKITLVPKTKLDCMLETKKGSCIPGPTRCTKLTSRPEFSVLFEQVGKHCGLRVKWLTESPNSKAVVLKIG